MGVVGVNGGEWRCLGVVGEVGVNGGEWRWLRRLG